MLVLGSVERGDPAAVAAGVDARAPSAARGRRGLGRGPVDFDDPFVHDAHIAVMDRLLNEPVDTVFTGEVRRPAGRALELEHVRLAPRHDLRHAVRADRRLGGRSDAGVRAYLCRRVVITGAESTGTTTLARALAERLGTVWVPEVGRAVSEARGIPARGPTRTSP